MNYKYCCVIDKDGFYTDFVLVHMEPDGDGRLTERLESRVLQDGERLVETPAPGELVRAQWDGGAWREAATEEEIEAARQQREQQL